MGIGRFVYTPILPYMADGLSMPAQDGGLIASANFLGYLAGALLGSSSRLRGDPRTWFLGALVASALTSAAMAFTAQVEMFLVIRFMSGVASAFVLVFSAALVLERLTLSGRADLSALFFAGVGIGIAFSAILIAFLGHIAATWEHLWLASAGATLVFAGGAAVLVPKTTPALTETTKPNLQDAPKPEASGSLAGLFIAYGLFGFGYVITATFVSTIARTVPALQPAEPWVWLCVGVCAAPSILIWNRIANRIRPRPAFALACVLEAAGVAMTALSQHPLVFLFGAALLGVTFMGITALGLTQARRHAEALGPDRARTLLAGVTASFGLGQVAGPWFAGQLHAMTGSFQAPSLAAAAALIAAGLIVLR
ncbi:YbfB/YjiJ family MFS transporter [Roseibium denhamense]|nr:YbfB/YjiJ family MFS transporter [Roseibium denhamense]